MDEDDLIEEQPVVAVEAEPAPAPIEEPAPAPVPEPAKRTVDAPDWAMRRIHEETNRRQEEARARQAAEREAAELRAVLEKLQKGDKPADAPARPAPKTDDYDAAVRAGVERQRFVDDTHAVLRAGQAAFPNFDDALKRLAAVEVITNDDCVADIIGVAGRDGAHILVDKLAGDLEQAERIAKMSQRARITELTKMNMTEQPKPAPAVEQPKPAPKPAAAISKAPPPKPRMDPVGAPVENNDLLNDNLSDEAWFALYRKERKV